jgi:hypothetical protein
MGYLAVIEMKLLTLGVSIHQRSYLSRTSPALSFQGFPIDESLGMVRKKRALGWLLFLIRWSSMNEDMASCRPRAETIIICSVALATVLRIKLYTYNQLPSCGFPCVQVALASCNHEDPSQSDFLLEAVMFTGSPGLGAIAMLQSLWLNHSRSPRVWRRERGPLNVTALTAMSRDGQRM